jgi:hypothetical protein
MASRDGTYGIRSVSDYHVGASRQDRIRESGGSRQERIPLDLAGRQEVASNVGILRTGQDLFLLEVVHLQPRV